MYPFTDTIWNVEVLSATVGRIETYSKVVVMNNQRDFIINGRRSVVNLDSRVDLKISTIITARNPGETLLNRFR